MATVALPRRALPRVSSLFSGTKGVALGLGALLLISLYARTRALGEPFWIDEGLSVGIASHPFLDIPGVLREDGSPPLYYMVLHVWMSLFGRSEGDTQTMSLLFALATVPVGFWAGRSLFGVRAGWTCAALCALEPFLTLFTHETRMYALMMLLSLIGAASLLHAFVYRRRGHLIVLALVLAAMAYTHNWAIFYGVGTLAALVVCLRASDNRRGLAKDAALAYGGALLLFAPWLPTLGYQSQHTGAPWAQAPNVKEIWNSFTIVLGGRTPAVALALGGGAGLARLVKPKGDRATARGATEGGHPASSAVFALIALGLGTILSAWIASQLSPAWAARYFAVLFGPLILLAAAGIAKAGRLGLVALALTFLIWGLFPGSQTFESKGLEKNALGEVTPFLQPGDLVISTHPERLPVIDYYMPRGMRYVTTMGVPKDPGVMDWRDALRRFRATPIRGTLEPLLDTLPVRRRVLIVRPNISQKGGSWTAPWTRLVARRSAKWFRLVNRDPRFQRVAVVPPRSSTINNGVRVILYQKVSATPPPRPAG